jgi:PAN domain
MPGSVDPYYPMSPDRYPMPGGDRYPMMPGGDRYPMMPGERYPMTHGPDRYPMPPVGDRYPMPPGSDRYPMPPGSDRYPMPPTNGRYPMTNGGERYPMPSGGDRYPMSGGADRYYPRPGIGDPLDSKYPPPTSNRYPEDDRYGGKDPYANKDRYNPDDRGPPVGMYPDTRNPPNRGQPIDRPPYSQPFDRPNYSPRPYPDGPDSKYPMMGPYRPGYSENRFPVGNDKFPTNIYKYGNSLPPYSPGVMSYMPYPDMGDRGYGQRAPRPPYAVMVGFGGQQGGFGGQQGGFGGQQGGGGGGNGISDTFGMPYGPPGMGRPPIQSGTRCDEIDSYKQMGLRQKMKKQYVRRSVFAPTLTLCQRECTNNPGFICRSFNYRDDGERSTTQGSGETFNCELSDRDTRELDLNNSQQFETGNSDFYERSIGGRSNDAECLDVSQVCNEDGMEFTLRTNEQFTGRIYSYGFYDR